MANNKEEKLFTAFPPVTTEQWEEVITKDLKGADYQKKLVWRTAEGFNVRPYYRAEDLAAIRHLGSESGEFPYVRGTKRCNCWRIHQTIPVTCPQEANALALKLIEGGVESLGFSIADKEFSAADLETLLAGIGLDRYELVFCGCGARKVAELVIEKASAEKLDPEKVRVSFILDPIVNKLTLKGSFGCSEDGGKAFDAIAGLIRKSAPFKRMRFVGVNGQQFHNSGSTIVQELAFTLAVGHEYVVKLMEAGLSVDEAAPAIRFSMAVSSNYFMEIAKFRAARMLWANIMKPYNPTRGCASKMFVHAVTSKWNQTVYDAYVNMLRGTTEAMSATIAGVHSLEVTPFDAAYEQPTDFSERIARNVQLLLKNESHFDQVVDPAGGSYYIETLTQSIAEQAWALFKQVEEKGGYIAAFKEGFVQDAVEASAANKDKNVATRRISLLGTNQFPNFTEVAGEAVTEQTVVPGSPKCCCKHQEAAPSVRPLKPYRGAMAFEQMRLKVDRSGKEPKAFMLTAGSLAMARARAQFSCNFFACAGIRVIDNTFFHSVEEGAKAALESGAEIVVVCASDDDYATLAPRVKELIGDKAILVVAGAPACQAELEAQGIKNFISVRSNVLETLQNYLKELGI
ncbi:methylmalonyl-CoA mutase family protein [Gallalistipes aquisgranensis]|uniref:methylmalonyl-CoA mutase family protein n=1 Tax=Gallalistipes aquisgranensis TaxID=2779358 RepID=UPI001CF884F0|nr:methylmalonyl-CoA mutase family protein [Gallalistipes aquisgranensis]MBE5034294.1 acyl-CoA mutase large subunit family protein [Gallalistipes aquisgranensis]